MLGSDYIPAPYSTGGDNEYKVLKFTSTTTHAQDAIPVAWHGKYVRITVIGTASGDVLHWAFAVNDSDAEVDRAVTATAAGASTKVGGILIANVVPTADRRTPNANLTDTVYFVRESSDTCTVYMELVE